jgi:ubiquinone/menaquinone biosynthesis C-methylase UbiE
VARTVYDYGAFAWCYEAIARFYSLGAIGRVKASQVAAMRPGDRVLYVGVGMGEDAILAARKGVQLSCLDVSPAMLGRLRARLEVEEAEGPGIDFVLADLFEYEPGARFDVVVANFVLNLYAAPEMSRALARMRSWLVPGGRMMVADFSLPARSWAWLAALYYRPLNWIAWLLGLCALHPIHDYRREMEVLGLSLEAREGVRVLPFGPRFFESLTGRDSGGRSG